MDDHSFWTVVGEHWTTLAHEAISSRSCELLDYVLGKLDHVHVADHDGESLLHAAVDL